MARDPVKMNRNGEFCPSDDGGKARLLLRESDPRKYKRRAKAKD